METPQLQQENHFFVKLATFIVDKRNGFFLIFFISIIFCIFSSQWVVVNDDLTSYLPAETETRQGLELMEAEFTTYGSARIMLDHVTWMQAQHLAESLRTISGVSEVVLDNSPKHLHNAAVLFEITFDGEATDATSLTAMEALKEQFSAYDIYISSEVGASLADTLNAEMRVVMFIAIVIICCVLLFTSKTYLEIPVLLLTFGAAALLNMGSNFLLGEISFVSDSIAVVLQLALAIDYAIILCHRYTEERAFHEPREAAIFALSKAIPEISSSSLTTISGMIALIFMQFKIGADMGIVLAKSILCSLLTVFTLMPGLLLLFSKGMDKTRHRSFVPDITPWGKMIYKTRFLVPPVFLVLLTAGFYLSNQCNYVYGYSAVSTIKQNESQIAAQTIEDTFGSTNLVAILVPAGDYETEGKLLQALAQLEITESVTGLANIEAMDGYMLTDRLTPRQFSELTDLDIEAARLLYSAYAAQEGAYGKIVEGIDNLTVPILDMFFFLYEEKEAGYITLEEALDDTLNDLYGQLQKANVQLQGQHYNRLLLETNLPVEGKITFDWLEKLHVLIAQYYPESVLLVGDSTSQYDLAKSFTQDNRLISILSAVFVMLILLFTFQSAGLPVLLMLIIQGSIWFNFSVPTLLDTNIFFMSYLIVSAIQMGANIDYAIVITTRYKALKQTQPLEKAMMTALNQAFPTIITSGTILASAGLLIGRMSSDPAISSIGACLGRGTMISMILVMGVLPQILLLGDFIIERTAFTLKKPVPTQSHTGTTRLQGHIKGYVSGMVDAQIHGTINGEIHAVIDHPSAHIQNPAEQEEDAYDHVSQS